MRRSPLALALWIAVSACEGVASDERDRDAGTGTSPLDVLDPAAVLDLEDTQVRYSAQVAQVVLGRRAVFAGDAVAAEVLTEEVTAELDRLAIDADIIIEPATIDTPRSVRVVLDDEGEPYVPDPPVVDGARCGYAESTFGLAPDTSCHFLVRRAREAATLRGVEIANERPLDPELREGVYDPAAIDADYVDAILRGIDGTTSAVLDGLQRAGLCDESYASFDAAYDRGFREANAAFQAALAVRLAGTGLGECAIGASIIGPAAEDAAARIESQLGEPLCPGYTPRDASEEERIDEANRRREDGTRDGMRAARATAATELAGSWVCVPPAPVLPEALDLPGAPLPPTFPGTPAPPTLPIDSADAPPGVYFAGTIEGGDRVVCSALCNDETCGGAVCYVCPQPGLWCGFIDGPS